MGVQGSGFEGLERSGVRVYCRIYILGSPVAP